MPRLLALLIAVVVLATSCSGEEKSAAGPPAPSTPAPSTPAAPASPVSSSPPAKAVGVHVTLQQLVAADPCGFVDAKVLGTYGKATITPDPSYTSCSFEATGASGKYLTGALDFDVALNGTSPGDEPQARKVIDGVNVYAQWKEDTELCLRDVVPFAGAVISLHAGGEAVPAATPCAAADALTRSVVQALATGKTRAAVRSKESLAHLDACQLLRPAEIARVPGSDRKKHPAFGGHGCTWGGEDIRLPSVYVALSPGDPPTPEADTGGQSITLQGRRAVVQPKARNDMANLIGPSLPSCSVTVNYQPVRPAQQGWVETLYVTVDADRDPASSLCSLAKDLASVALGRIPKA